MFFPEKMKFSNQTLLNKKEINSFLQISYVLF